MNNLSKDALNAEILLRDVKEEDLPILFEHQLDPEANRMAVSSARDRDAFMAHWSTVLADESIMKKTIIIEDQVAGDIVMFGPIDKREVGYWIGSEFWGRGIATKALELLLTQVQQRPLFAHVAKHNIASYRVLEKCGFVKIREDKVMSEMNTEMVEEFVLRLD
jgi:RimJ/RimL family protein N-acetyltransferase